MVLCLTMNNILTFSFYFIVFTGVVEDEPEESGAGYLRPAPMRKARGRSLKLDRFPRSSSPRSPRHTEDRGEHEKTVDFNDI